MTDIGQGSTQARRSSVSRAEGIVEKTCKLMSALALMVLLVVVGVDIVTRWVFNFSFEVSDEVGAYMLVAIAFLSLPVSHINGAFHRVEFIQARLSQRAQLISRFAFDLLALVILRHLRLAVHRARALILAVRRPCADLPGNAALDTEIAPRDRHGRAVPLVAEVAGGRPEAFAVSRKRWPGTR